MKLQTLAACLWGVLSVGEMYGTTAECAKPSTVPHELRDFGKPHTPQRLEISYKSLERLILKGDWDGVLDEFGQFETELLNTPLIKKVKGKCFPEVKRQTPLHLAMSKLVLDKATEEEHLGLLFAMRERGIRFDVEHYDFTQNWYVPADKERQMQQVKRLAVMFGADPTRFHFSYESPSEVHHLRGIDTQAC